MNSQFEEILKLLKQQSEIIETLRNDQVKLKERLDFDESKNYHVAESVKLVDDDGMLLKKLEVPITLLEPDETIEPFESESLLGNSGPLFRPSTSHESAIDEQSDQEISLFPMLLANSDDEFVSYSVDNHGFSEIQARKRELLKKRTDINRRISRKQFGLSNPTDDLLSDTSKILDDNRPLMMSMKHCKSEIMNKQSEKVLPRIKSAKNLLFIPSNERNDVSIEIPSEFETVTRKYDAMDSSTANLTANMSHSLWENELSRRILALHDSTVVVADNDKNRPMILTSIYSSASLSPTKSSTQMKAIASEKAVRPPERRHPIWFKGDGLMKCDWSALPGGHGLSKELESLEERLDYRRYIAIVETMLTAKWRALESPEMIMNWWKQMIIVLDSFAMRLIDSKNYDCGMELYRKGMSLSSREDILGRLNKSQMEAHLNDTYSYLFFMKKKYKAAMGEVVKSIKSFDRLHLWYNMCVCMIHKAAIQSRLRCHQESLNTLHEILHMLEIEKIKLATDISSSPTEMVCMIAITFHNIAVEEFNMQNYTDACDYSQNAMKLARSCLSCSSKWIKMIDATHDASVRLLSANHDSQSIDQERINPNIAEIYGINVAGEI